MNVGGGAVGFLSDHVGVRFDLRYFRNIKGVSQEDLEDFPVTLGEPVRLRYWTIARSAWSSRSSRDSQAASFYFTLRARTHDAEHPVGILVVVFDPVIAERRLDQRAGREVERFVTPVSA